MNCEQKEPSKNDGKITITRKCVLQNGRKMFSLHFGRVFSTELCLWSLLSGRKTVYNLYRPKLTNTSGESKETPVFKKNNVTTEAQRQNILKQILTKRQQEDTKAAVMPCCGIFFADRFCRLENYTSSHIPHTLFQ